MEIKQTYWSHAQDSESYPLRCVLCMCGEYTMCDGIEMNIVQIMTFGKYFISIKSASTSSTRVYTYIYAAVAKSK